MKTSLSVLITALLLATPAAAQVTGGAISVRDSATGALVANVGDTTNSAIRINCVTGCGGSGGTSQADNSAVTSITGVGALYDTTPPSITDGNVGLPRMDASRYLYAVFPSAQSVNASQTGTWTVQPGNTANTTAWLVTAAKSSSATLANVSSSATNVTCLASNASRKGATIFNDSTSDAYVKFGATASATSYTVKITGGGFYELRDAGYTGIIDCIWSSANGNARVTEW